MFHPVFQSLVPLIPIRTSSGLPDRYRLPFVATLVVVGVGGLTLLAYKIRDADPDGTGGRPPDSTLDPDELERGGATNSFERLIRIVNRPGTYAVMLGTTLGAGALELVFGWFGGEVWALLFFAGLLLTTKAFLRFGWPYFESFYDRRQPDERDPDSLRFQGFSTDSLILMTLVALMLLGMLTLVLVESRLL